MHEKSGSLLHASTLQRHRKGSSASRLMRFGVDSTPRPPSSAQPCTWVRTPSTAAHARPASGPASGGARGSRGPGGVGRGHSALGRRGLGNNAQSDSAQNSRPAAAAAVPPQVLLRPKSRWVAAHWPDLPGWTQDSLGQAWPALLRSCQRPHPAFLPLCPEIRKLAIGSDAEQRQWLMNRPQP